VKRDREAEPVQRRVFLRRVAAELFAGDGVERERRSQRSERPSDDRALPVDRDREAEAAVDRGVVRVDLGDKRSRRNVEEVRRPRGVPAVVIPGRPDDRVVAADRDGGAEVVTWEPSGAVSLASCWPVVVSKR